MVPAQMQQNPTKSTTFPLPNTYPIPEVATTSILEGGPKRQIHEAKRVSERSDWQHEGGGNLGCERDR
ncbi:hypothetical protein V6N13_095586 [Hibiscus sabdariffa]